MPKGPRGEKRPAGAIGRAILVAKIATGQVDDVTISSAIAEMARKGGKKRAENMSAAGRKEMPKGSGKRWGKSD